MQFADGKTETKTFEERGDETVITTQVQTEPVAEATDAELFSLYEKIAKSRPGTRDAQIFEAVREWTFSDFSVPPCKFAGISSEEMAAWQKRHRINLSSGHIRPAHIDLARGHAWGTVRREDHVNGRHTKYGPPSREELLEMMGSSSSSTSVIY
jgi:hypothetical protein